MEQLKELADELGIRNPATLYKAAKGRHLHASLRLAKEALEQDVGKQVFGRTSHSFLRQICSRGPHVEITGRLGGL